MRTFELTIRTPYEDLYVGKEVYTLSCVSQQGALQIFAHHASLTAAVGFSIVRVKDTKNIEESYVIRNGVLFFDNAENKAILLALHGEAKSELSYKTAKEYLDFLRECLDKGEDLSKYHVLYLEGEKLAVEEQLRQV
ncbi:hypothetical protein COV82_04020 [Candidatus Peregrinibacteria bacterium CG11_big_fil_rev_8_21_14_0_20_46_8]|nr:MAG: hypothetical protein COV82_04020 [Candidatus Peregrinibacteria bacterium CG11_big_fil_rev_8_21_14_0_20_46_8]